MTNQPTYQQTVLTRRTWGGVIGELHFQWLRNCLKITKNILGEFLAESGCRGWLRAQPAHSNHTTRRRQMVTGSWADHIYYLPTIYLSIIYLLFISLYLSIFLSFYLLILLLSAYQYLSVYLSMYLFIYLSICTGQAWLYLINGKNYGELFVAFEHLGEDLMIVVTILSIYLSFYLS